MNTESDLIHVEQLEQSARELPALPQTTAQIISILGDPLFEVSDLIKVISLDQALTTDLLRVANSASYVRARPASNVGEAIVRLGSGTIMVMAIAESAKPPADIDLNPFGLSVEEYWRHCVASVAAAEELNSRRIASFGTGFSATALLHDYGKLLLSKHITPERLQKLAQYRVEHPAARPVDSEQVVLGIDHGLAGSIVARYWNLPEEMAFAMENHHNPVDWEHDLTNGVIVASQIAWEMEGNMDFSMDGAQLIADAMLALGLNDETYDAVLVASQKRFENLLELFS